MENVLGEVNEAVDQKADQFSAFFSKVSAMILPILGKIVLALIVWLIGKFAIKKLLKLLEKNKKFQSLEGTVRTFTRSFIKIAAYAVLIVSVVGILGVETASIVAALASAGVAIGLALQGTLSNLAGGIMLVIFKPFKHGDYVDAAGASGTVTDVTLFYTVLTTVDNKRITIPNGSLMNANVVDYSAEKTRRVDLVFSCAKTESPDRVEKLILDVMGKNDKILCEPEKPFACVTGGTNEAMEITARAWVNTPDYWDVYYDLTHSITAAFGEAGVQAPAVRVTSGK